MRTSLALLISVAALSPGLVRADPPPIGSVALDHIAIHVQDVDRSTAFYKEVFELRQVPAPVPFARWLVLSNGTMLHIVGGRTAPVDEAKWDHFAFSCADMRAMIARLDARGIKWSSLDGKAKPQTQIRGEGVQQIFVQDPDGYWIEINDAHRPATGR